MFSSFSALYLAISQTSLLNIWMWGFVCVLCLPALVQPSPFFLKIMVLLLINIAEVHQLCLYLHLGPGHLGIIKYEVQKKGSTKISLSALDSLSVSLAFIPLNKRVT